MKYPSRLWPVRCVGAAPLTGPRAGTHRVTSTSSINQHPNPVVTQTRLACLLIRGIEANMDTRNTPTSRDQSYVHRWKLLETTRDAIMAQQSSRVAHHIASHVRAMIYRTYERQIITRRDIRVGPAIQSPLVRSVTGVGHASSAGRGAQLRVPRVGTCHGVMSTLIIVEDSRTRR